MPGVFVSHAHADSKITDPFVDDLIRLGCGVPPESILYTSGEDTGVPSGSNLNSFVQAKVAEASIVVAIISPTFQNRPFCVAELGAAWSRVGLLLPLAVPGMQRTDVEGVLDGLVVKHLDDSAALDELHDRLGKALGKTTDARTWGRFKAKWLANVDSYAADLPNVRTASPAEFDVLKADIEATRDALKESENERRELEEQVEQLSQAKSAEEVRSILLPKKESARFEACVEELTGHLAKVPKIVGDALWYELAEGSMPWPNRFEEPDRADAAIDAIRQGSLRESSDEVLMPNHDYRPVQRASKAVDELQDFLLTSSSDFANWFHEEYDLPPDLRTRHVWDQIV
jgi:hypothetical protein